MSRLCLFVSQESENPAYVGRLTSSSQQGSLSDLSLFSSPSMPNISLGRPHVPSSSSVSARKTFRFLVSSS